MERIAQLVEALFSKDHNKGYEALKELTAESGRSPRVYPFFDRFVSMMSMESSYVRSRGLILIAANAGWDSENKIGGILEEFLVHILDKKPITARQCVKLLPDIGAHKPELAGRIREALKSADTSVYNENMRPLVDQDIREALKKLG